METIYERNGLRRVVNACGRMTALGVSTIHDEVGKSLIEAAGSYVVMNELMERAGELISVYTGAEDSCVTICASSGIMIAAAACIAGNNMVWIERLPDSSGLKNEIIIQKGHAVNFNASITQMLRMGGARIVECGQVNKVSKDHIRFSVTENTAALFYCKSHHCVQKGMLTVEEMAEIAHEYNLPLIVDAAAEEDLRLYLQQGADLVIYSGAKALNGPTSGFITGRKDLIVKCRKQYQGVGRAAKVGKEGIMGLLKALERYDEHDEKMEEERQLRLITDVMQGIRDIDCLTASIAQDEAGRKIYRLKLKVDEAGSPYSAREIVEKLHEGDPAVFVRDHYANIGIIYIDPRPMLPGDQDIVINRLKSVLKQEGGKV